MRDAEKSLHIICVSLSNKRVHGIIPRSLKNTIQFNLRNRVPHPWLPAIPQSIVSY